MQALAISAPFFSIIFMGFVFARRRKLHEDGLRWMNVYLLSIALPALFFDMLRQTPLSELQRWGFVLANTGSTLTIYLCAWLVARFFLQRAAKEAVAFGFSSAYSNIGYMGVPLVLLAFGDQAAIAAALVFSFDNALIFILTPALMSQADAQGVPLYRALGRSVRAVFTHPFIVATLLGVAATALSLPIPAPVEQLLLMLKQTAGPCALFSLGVMLGLKPVQLKHPDVAAVLLFKLLLHPLLVYVALSLTPGIPTVWLQTAVLMATLPPAANVYLMAQQYGVFVERATAIVVVGTLIALLSVTGVLHYFQSSY